jgi:hypothetical protein
VLNDPDAVPEDVTEIALSSEREKRTVRSGDNQQLSLVPEASTQPVRELADEGQAIEASTIEGAEQAADQPETEADSHPATERSPRRRNTGSPSD